MSASRAIVVRASAGTGKTFRLAHRYLALLFAGARPEEILATTFTRKAAGEILGRILTRLAEAARDETARQEMLAHLAPRPKTEPSAKDCETLLGNLLARLHAFQVRTMDSWFVHLARLHGPELGLPPMWRVLDPAEATEQAAEQASELIAAFDEARVRDLVRDLQQQEFRRGVHEGLVDLTNSGLEILRDSAEAAWTKVDAGKQPSDVAVQKLLQTLDAAEFPSGARWSSVQDKLRAAVEEEDWSAWLLTGPIKNLRAGDPQYYKKPIPEELLELFRVGMLLAQQALLHERARRLAAARELLTAADKRVDAARRRAGAFDFGDLPRWLADAAWAGDSAAFRLDGRVHHVLLDEFQDTATPQWRALSPLVDAARGAEDGTLFCVGDGKQSIYGWRSGEPRLLGAVADALHAATEPLAKSFRTAQAVLDEVNAQFGALVDDLSAWGDDALQLAAERFTEHWDAHSTAKEHLPGRFEVWAAPVPKEANAAEEVRTLAMSRAVAIAEELRAAGRADATVAILTRKNADVAAMVTALRAQGVEASAEGNVALTESLLVAAALAALDLADRPDDTASARLVAVSPLAQALGWEDDAREAFARRVRRNLLERGFGPWLAQLAAAASADAPWADLDARRFARLVEAGYEWDAKARTRAAAVLRPSAFAAHARAMRMEDPSPSVVRVMTVHKSKGLEFDAVVLALTGG
ncbi:MAG: UvrD-helicase domain-containing protein, partial [Planctomycetota bacterium]|nr:UvrD-helicase domain-containing protein [Planctomycetota bacterium]